MEMNDVYYVLWSPSEEGFLQAGTIRVFKKDIRNARTYGTRLLATRRCKEMNQVNGTDMVVVKVNAAFSVKLGV